MKYEFLSLSLLVVIVSEMYTPKIVVLSTPTDSRRFLVVSDESEAKQFFWRIFRKSKTKTHRIHRTYDYYANHPNEMIQRKQICEDVGNSYTFRQDGKLPYEKYAGPLSRLIKNFKYPDVELPIVQLSSQPVEKMFGCLAQDSHQDFKFFVSDEYDLETDSPDPSNHLVGRFIFQSFTKDWPRLYGLAELPAKSFFDPDHNVESIYLDRRGSNSVESTVEQDALCGLSKSNLQRICVAVFNSQYFEERFEFSNVYEVKGYCELKTVSFQTDEGKAKVSDGRDDFKEWMLSCKPNENESIFDYWQSRWMLSCDTDHSECTFDYWLSHAYHTNQIFVYFWNKDTGDVFLENLSVDVRLAYGDSKDKKMESAPVNTDDENDEDDSVSNRSRMRFDHMNLPWMTDISFYKNLTVQRRKNNSKRNKSIMRK